MTGERLKKQLAFFSEIDKMKSVFRRNLIMDGTRRENDAEHSWSIAMLAVLLEEYAAKPVNLERVMKMLLAHDLVEVYAGDTFAYDAVGNQSKEDREREAADRLYSILPEEQGKELRDLWEEFDRMDTDDSRYAAALDRIQPLLCNYATEGHTWKIGYVDSAMVYKRMEPIKTGAPELWQIVEDIITDSVNRGILRK